MLADVVRCGKVRIHIASLCKSETFVLGGGDVVLDEVLVAEGTRYSLDHVVASSHRERRSSQCEFVADDQLTEGCDYPQLNAEFIDLCVSPDGYDIACAVLDHRNIAV